MNSSPERPFDEAPSDFLRNLVEAMRRVVETSRDRSLAEMREAVETEAGQLDESRSAREGSLRERAEADITAVGTWERAEIDRISAEAARKVQARSRQLDQELAQLAAATNAEHAALAERADAYEREVAAFMEGLEGIDDPAAFAAAARRMPSPTGTGRVQLPKPAFEPTTDVAAEPAAAVLSAPEAVAPEAPAEPSPSEPVMAAPAPSVATEPADMAAVEAPVAPDRPVVPQPVASDVAPMPAAESAAPVAAGEQNGNTAPADADEATAIQVRGLSSFGAITSFKQSLERLEGIHSVTLGLGPSGEFVYTATHAPSIDLNAAIQSIEGNAEIERDGGTLRVRVGRRPA